MSANPRLDRIERLIEQSRRATKKGEVANNKVDAKFKNDLRRWASLDVKEAQAPEVDGWKALTLRKQKRQRPRKPKQESLEYQRRTDHNLTEITDKLKRSRLP